jgi:sugar phosphate isomerase/epimerase
MVVTNISLAAFPARTHEEALQQALAGVQDPMFGELGLQHIQLVPQNRGTLDVERAHRLHAMVPQAQFRLHANVRVLPEHRFADLTNAHMHEDYFEALQRVHEALGAKVYSAHSGSKHEGSWAQTVSNTLSLQDRLGCPVAIEGQYPSTKPMHLSFWQEYQRLLDGSLYYVIDLSHLNIVAHRTRRQELGLVRELLACERCLEVHVSDNDGTGDWHALCGREVWWMDALNAIHPGAVVFSEGNQLRRDRVLQG